MGCLVKFRFQTGNTKFLRSARQILQGTHWYYFCVCQDTWSEISNSFFLRDRVETWQTHRGPFQASSICQGSFSLSTWGSLLAALPFAIAFSGRVVSSETLVVTHLQSKYNLCPCVDLCLFTPDISLRLPRAVSSQSIHWRENCINAYCFLFKV